MELHNILRHSFVIGSIAALAACSSADSGTTTPTSTTTTISGSIFAAPIDGAAVYVTDLNGNDIAGPVTTVDGAFTVTLDNTDLTSTLAFESSGGDFTDEATGNPNVDPAGPMSVIAEANSLSSTANSIHATPGSTIIRKLVSKGMSLTDAQNAFATAFGYTPDTSIAPIDTTNPAPGAEDAQILAGLRAAAFSQLTNELGLAPDQQFDLFDALTEDLLSPNHLLDGTGATTLALRDDIQNRYATAFLNYHNNGLMMPEDEFNANNKTVLTSDKIGLLPFGKVAYTQDYRVQYMDMMSYVGKTTFTVKVTDHDGTTPVSNLTPKLEPVMNMATMRHDTPLGSVTNNNDGTYKFDIYYLMPNMMGGYWDLGVDLDGTTANTAHFYPTVMMPMDGTPRVIFRGLAGVDVIPTMEGDQPRPYIMFKESITNSASAGKHDFSIFLVAREDMMSHPAIDVGLTMNAGTAYQLTVASVTVEMLVQQGSNWTPVTVTNDGSGYFSATDIAGLTASVDPDTGLAPIRVKLSVNGVPKTSSASGAAPVTDVTDYHTFNVKLP